MHSNVDLVLLPHKVKKWNPENAICRESSSSGSLHAEFTGKYLAGLLIAHGHGAVLGWLRGAQSDAKVSM